MSNVLAAFTQRVVAFRQSTGLAIAITFIANAMDLGLSTSINIISPCLLLTIETNQVCNPLSNTTKVLQFVGKGGIIMAAKEIAEILTKALGGYAVDQLGHKMPLVIGCVCTSVATIGFGYSQSFVLLVIMRVCQGIGSGLSVVAGLAMISLYFPDDKKRSWAMAIALAGSPIGASVGFPMGAFAYEFIGQKAPFLILAGVSLIDACLRLMAQTPVKENNLIYIAPPSTSPSFKYFALLRDPYVLLAVGCTFCYTTAAGMQWASLPSWVIEKLDAQPWQIGVCSIVCPIFQVLSMQITARLMTNKDSWWRAVVLGLLIHCSGLIWSPLCSSTWEEAAPLALTFTGYGVAHAAISILIAFIADQRHNGKFGQIFALQSACSSLGIVVGSVVGTYTTLYTSYKWACWGCALILFVYSLLACFFKKLKDLEYEDSEVKTLTEKENYGTMELSDLETDND